MKPHLNLAHRHWKNLLQPHDTAIDATCGNGKDTTKLLELLPQGHVISIDIQEEAILRCRQSISSDRVTFLCQSHASLPSASEIKLVVYNLGYLPGGDKKVTTQVSSTLRSVSEALRLLAVGGALSIMCYPGHAEGAKEQEALLQWASILDVQEWEIFFYTWRKGSPNLLWIKNLRKQ